jgi:AraC-like DNA-binding protein
VNPTLVRGDMRYWRMQPDARLRPWVVCYFLVEPTGLIEPTGPTPPAESVPPQSQQQLLLPDGYSEIVFKLDSTFERWDMDDPDKRTVMSSSYLIGGRSNTVLTRNLGRVRLAGTKLDSRLLRAIIGMPLSEFRDSTLTLGEVNSTALLDLDESVQGARSPDDIKAILDRFFVQALLHLPAADAIVSELLKQIHLSYGTLSIMQWLRAQHLDSRTLERRFCAFMGMMPKQYSRIVRFKHSYHHLMFNESDTGALGAHLDAYYDQSHFNREFKKFLGAPPSAVLTDRSFPVTTVSDHLLRGEFELDEARAGA